MPRVMQRMLYWSEPPRGSTPPWLLVMEEGGRGQAKKIDSESVWKAYLRLLAGEYPHFSPLSALEWIALSPHSRRPRAEKGNKHTTRKATVMINPTKSESEPSSPESAYSENNDPLNSVDRESETNGKAAPSTNSSTALLASLNGVLDLKGSSTYLELGETVSEFQAIQMILQLSQYRETCKWWFGDLAVAFLKRGFRGAYKTLTQEFNLSVAHLKKIKMVAAAFPPQLSTPAGYVFWP